MLINEKDMFSKIKYSNFKIINQIIKNKICTECNPNNIYGNICIKQVVHFNNKNKELELIDINPCNKCINFQKGTNKYWKIVNNENLGYCKLFRIKETKKQIDTITSRFFFDLCGPCGKFFQKK